MGALNMTFWPLGMIFGIFPKQGLAHIRINLKSRRAVLPVLYSGASRHPRLKTGLSFASEHPRRPRGWKMLGAGEDPMKKF